MYRILNESRRDDMLLPYVNLLRGKGINTNVSRLKQFLLKKFVNEGLIRNLSLGSNFYLAGVARYYFNGDLTTNKVLNVFDESQTDEFKQDICERLNACILILRNAHIDSVGTSFEQPEDFGELKLMALLRKYNAKINQVLGIVPDKKKVEGKKEVVLDENPSVGNGYTFDILYSYADARKYNKFTEPDAWCITYGEQHYNGYIRRLGIHYVIFRQNGYESVPRKMGPNFTKRKPHDEYGNSLIALLQSNSNGEPKYITSRWNHGSYRDGSQGTEADHAYTKEEFCRITGVNDADLQRIFNIWKENREIKKRENAGNGSLTRKKNLDALRYVKYGQMRMNGGEDVRNVFKGLRANFLSGKRDGTIKKCICVLTIPIWGEDAETPESYVTILCDQGKMVFETFKLHTDYFWGTERIYISPENKDDWRSNRFNDAILIHHDNYHQIYSTRFHKLVDIQGTTKFKYISDGPASWNKDKCCYYEVAMSNNQRAFIDHDTNKPLRLPNGEFWFEDWTSCGTSCGGYSREVKMKEVTIKQCFLSILYDSAANMRFYLDLSTKRFFTPEEFEGYRILSYGQDAVFDDVYMIHYESDNNEHRGFYQLYKQGKPYHILGSDKYRNIHRLSRYASDEGLTLLNLVTLDGECKIYDYAQDKELEFYDYTGQKVAVGSVSSAGLKANDMGLIWVKLFNFRFDHCALYDIKEQRFLLNPYSKSYIFYLYSTLINSNNVSINGGPYVSIDNIKPEMHNNYIRRADIKIETIRKFTDSYSSQIGAMPSNENEDKADFIQKINNGEITTDFLWENTSKNDVNFIIENVLQQLGNVTKKEKDFIKEHIERQVLNEISVVDAYQRFYQKVPQEDYKTIVSTIQGNNSELHQDTKWVLGLYKHWGKIVIEDLYKLHNDEGTGALDIFRRARDRRMTRGIDLNRFKSISELVVWVREKLNADEILGRTKGEMSNAVNKAANDAYFIYEDDIWKVLIPKTYEASCYWGQGTEWCTATRSTDNWYKEYSQQGPLFININKQTGDKYQFHFESEQFMDEDDLSIDEPIFENMDASTELINFYQSYFNDDKEKFFRLKYELFDDDYYYSYKIYKVNSNFYIYSKTYDKFITNEPILDYYIDDNYNDYTIIRLELVEGWVIYNSYYDEVFAEDKFDAIGEFDGNWAYVKKGTQWNIIDDTAELLSDHWFDYMYKYEGDPNLIIVADNSKVNLFDLSNRELLLNEWVDKIEYDEDNEFLGIVKKDNKYNLLNDNGEFILPMFVDEYETNTIFTGSKYLIPIKLNGKWNFCGQYDKKLQSSIWFDDWAQPYSHYSDHDITVEVNGETYKVYFEEGYMQNEETWEKVRI